MIDRVIDWSVRNKFFVLLLVGAAALAGGDPFGHLDVSADAPPRLDHPRHEVSVAAFDEHCLA